MSDYIPLEILEKIINRLPVRSLIRFRSVSKPWKSLIDSSEFITTYQLTNTHPRQQHLLIRYTTIKHFTPEFISLTDDDNTFPRQRFPLNVPISIERLGKTRIVGSSKGLICFYNLDRMLHESGTVVIWNPFIRKSVVIDVVDTDSSFKTVVGFGVCCKTSDAKLVKVSYARSPVSLLPWQVEVFTLSSRVWRSVAINLPRGSIALCLNDLVVIDGVIYWHAFDRTNEVRFRTYNLVISFDLTTEVFTEINFPRDLVNSEALLIYKPTKSLAVVECNNGFYDVWIMDHGVLKSFTKLFRIKAPETSLVYRSVLEFRENGDVIMQMKNYSEEPSTVWSEVSTKLVAYEPFSEHINDLGICKGSGLFSVTSYTESLLLLNQPERI